MSGVYLRYRPDSHLGKAFPTTRYPANGSWPRAFAERVRSLMAGAPQIEIIEEDN